VALYVIGSDETAPFDCWDAVVVTGPVTLTPLPASHDEDGDGGTDYRELGADQTAGGLRDPFNPYDYYDVNHDGGINVVNDILGVAGAFGPPPHPRYVDYKDRGAVHPGPNVWNRGPPNGEIDSVNDILSVGQQFGHVCPHSTHAATTAFGAHPTALTAGIGTTAPVLMSVGTTAGYASSGQLLVDAETLGYDQGSTAQACAGMNPATQFCVTGRGNMVPAGNNPASHGANAVVWPKP